MSLTRELARSGISFYAPVVQHYARRSDRAGVRKKAPVQLFPGYLFVELDIEHTHTSVVTAMAGAVCFVRSGIYPCVVPADLIEELQQAPATALLHEGNIAIQHYVANDTLDSQIHDIITQESADKRIQMLNALLALPCHLFVRSA